MSDIPGWSCEFEDEYNIEHTWKLTIMELEFRRVTLACPEQWEVFLDGKQVGYTHLRHGVFSAYCPDSDGELVYEGNPEGDGIFKTEQERLNFLISAAVQIRSRASDEGDEVQWEENQK